MDYDAIVDYVTETGGVTVTEVLGMLDHQGVPTEGDVVMFWPYKPVVLWSGLSEEASDVLHQLLTDSRIEPYPSNLFVYAMDGQVLTLPLATAASVAKRYPYKKERWLPVVFNRRS